MRAMAIALGFLACGRPQPVEVHASFSYTAAQERSAIVSVFPKSILAQMGGTLVDPYPPTLPRVILDVTMLERARVDFSSQNLPSGGARFSGLRGALGGALLPAPSELRVYAGPAGSLALNAAGVVLLGRGPWQAN